MIDLPNGRNFQLWEYQVSHSSLLLRSPRRGDQKYNIDIIFFGVEFISVPRHLEDFAIVEAGKEEIQFLGSLIGKSVDRDNVFVLEAAKARHLVVAAGMKVDENELDIFDSPFD
jgi:hypothetical protein